MNVLLARGLTTVCLIRTGPLVYDFHSRRCSQAPSMVRASQTKLRPLYVGIVPMGTHTYTSSHPPYPTAPPTTYPLLTRPLRPCSLDHIYPAHWTTYTLLTRPHILCSLDHIHPAHSTLPTQEASRMAISPHAGRCSVQQGQTDGNVDGRRRSSGQPVGTSGMQGKWCDVTR